MIPVYKNLFTNPNLVGDGTWAEVARNLSIRPRPTLSGWWRQAPWFDFTVDGEWAVFTSLSASMGRDIGGTGTAAANTHASLTAGVEYTMSMIVKPDVSGYYRINQVYRGASYVSISGVPGAQVWCPAGVETPVSARGVAPAGTVYGGPRVMLGSTESLGAGVAVRARASCVTESTIYLSLDGSTKPDGLIQPEDFRVRWLGAVNASESVMEIELVRGLAGTDCVAGASTRDGKPAVRLIPTGSSRNTGAWFPIPAGAARDLATATGTIHLDAPLTGVLASSARVIAAESPYADKTTPAPNIAGSFPLRGSVSGLTSLYRVHLRHGGSLGSGDVWWTDIGLFAGVYDGPAFSGDSGVITIDGQFYVTSWEGEPNNSAPLAILSTDDFSGTVYDTLYVLSTVSNTWIRWQTPALRWRDPITLARSIDQPPAKAYTMRVSRRIFDEVRDVYTTPY